MAKKTTLQTLTILISVLLAVHYVFGANSQRHYASMMQSRHELFEQTREPSTIRTVEWTEMGQLCDLPSLNGAFVGGTKNIIILAGGVKTSSEHSSRAILNDKIYVVVKKSDGSLVTKEVGRLSQPLAFGASVSVEDGVVCLGGGTANG